ncbi:hypothetical protein [uncultured Legionella sp.]|uniref:hypothetical protein n=1 Tax=uncultured Legionella sp. TaxID=210934 RepID=UPI00261C8BB5|nr:hypothetical protein [uncultured Legionella sp.]
MKELLKKMKNTDTWYREDIGKVLAYNNLKIGDEQFFNQAIYQAQEAKLIEPISIPRQTNSYFNPGADLQRYNYQYKPAEIINWIKSKKWNLPQAFLKLVQNETISIVTSELELLQKSPSWSRLATLVINAISKYRKQELDRKKMMKKENLNDWIKQNVETTENIIITDREAEFIKKVLSDIFE